MSHSTNPDPNLNRQQQQHNLNNNGSNQLPPSGFYQTAQSGISLQQPQQQHNMPGSEPPPNAENLKSMQATLQAHQQKYREGGQSNMNQFGSSNSQTPDPTLLSNQMTPEQIFFLNQIRANMNPMGQPNTLQRYPNLQNQNYPYNGTGYMYGNTPTVSYGYPQHSHSHPYLRPQQTVHSTSQPSQHSTHSQNPHKMYPSQGRPTGFVNSSGTSTPVLPNQMAGTTPNSQTISNRQPLSSYSQATSSSSPMNMNSAALKEYLAQSSRFDYIRVSPTAVGVENRATNPLSTASVKPSSQLYPKQSFPNLSRFTPEQIQRLMLQSLQNGTSAARQNEAPTKTMTPPPGYVTVRPGAIAVPQHIAPRADSLPANLSSPIGLVFPAQATVAPTETQVSSASGSAHVAKKSDALPNQGIIDLTSSPTRSSQAPHQGVVSDAVATQTPVAGEPEYSDNLSIVSSGIIPSASVKVERTESPVSLKDTNIPDPEASAKRKAPDSTEQVHIFPNKKPQESNHSVLGIEIFKPTSSKHIDSIFGLSNFYVTELESLGMAPCIYEKGKRVVDPVWMLRRNRMVVSAVYCMEAALQFLTHLQKHPGAYATTGINPERANMLLMRLYLKLSFILSKYTNNKRRAEHMLVSAQILAKKDYSNFSTYFVAIIPAARFYAGQSLHRQAITLLKQKLEETVSLKTLEWSYAFSSELASLYLQNDEYTQAVEALETAFKLANQFNHAEIQIALSLKLIALHLKKRHYRSVALILPREDKLFPTGLLSPVLSELKTYFLTLKVIYLIEIGDLTSAKVILKQIHDYVDSWDRSIPVQEKYLMLNVPYPSDCQETNHSENGTSTEKNVTIKFFWFSRRQIISLVYLISGLVYKPFVYKSKSSLLFLEGIKRALNDINSGPAQSYTLGASLRRQKFYIEFVSVAMTHLSESYLLQWDLKSCHMFLNQAIALSAANNLWLGVCSRLLHIRGLLLHTLGLFDDAFKAYFAAYHACNDQDGTTAICLNLFTLISDSKFYPKMVEIVDKIQSRCGEPQHALILATIDFFKGIFGQEILVKKNNFSESLVKLKPFENSHLEILVHVSLGHLFLNTNTEVAEKIILIAYQFANQSQNPLGGMYTTSLLKRISTLLNQPVSLSKAAQEFDSFQATLKLLRSSINPHEPFPIATPNPPPTS